MSMDVLERPDIVVEDVLEKGPECEFEHDGCTIKAVAIGNPRCHPEWKPKLLCQGVLDFVDHAIEVKGRCGDCKRYVAECWSIVPI